MVPSLQRLSGLSSFSTVDYPGEFAAVFFTQGCALKCPWCHNQELCDFDYENTLYSQEKINQFLENRRNVLDAVVLSGGEPLWDSSGPEFLKSCKELGYKVGLHTAGVLPNKLDAYLDFIDWVGLDVKTLPHKYDELTKGHQIWDKVAQSLTTLIANKIHFEVRTSCAPEFLDVIEIKELMEMMSEFGVKNYAIQELRNPEDPSQECDWRNYYPSEIEEICTLGEQLFENFYYRKN